VPEPASRMAVLIDADNTSASHAAAILEELARYGVPTVKRAYGDWTTQRLVSWKTELPLHAIQPIQQFAYTTGKNATDGAMIIDAMDLLNTGRFDGFCIVSSDSDFARLAARIREQGVTVYGFGERKTPRPFVTACDKFIYLDVLRPDDEGDAAPAARATAKASEKKKTAKDPQLLATLRAAIDAVSDEDGWADLGAVGSHIAKQLPEFDPRNYGFTRLSELVAASGLGDMERVGDKQKRAMVRLKKSGTAGELGWLERAKPRR
jgi:uncharacterized LabA/DUF88 family protein